MNVEHRTSNEPLEGRGTKDGLRNPVDLQFPNDKTWRFSPFFLRPSSFVIPGVAIIVSQTLLVSGGRWLFGCFGVWYSAFRFRVSGKVQPV